MRLLFRRLPLVGRIFTVAVLAVLFYFTQNEYDSVHQQALPALNLDSAKTKQKLSLLEFHHTISHGQTLAQILSSSVVQPSDIFPALEALKRVFDPRRLKPGQELKLMVDSSGTLHQLTYAASPELLIRVKRAETGDFLTDFDSLRIVPQVNFLAGEINSTLYEAVVATEESPELLLAYTDIFQWDVDFFIDTRKGDRFRILYEKLFVEKENGDRKFVRYGKVLAATYEQADTSYFACFYEDSTGRSGYFDRNGNSFQKTFLKSPLNYRRISSFFSSGRRHPILKKVRAHTGVDFAAPQGTPVTATAEGTITKKEWEGGYGNCVIIAHTNHFTTLYGHLSKYAEGLQVGDRVKQGQVIGYVGSTGLATGSHLHYTMYLNSKPIDPLRIRPASADPLTPAQFQNFAKHRDQMLVWLDRPLPMAAIGPIPDFYID
ncbi:M23 family metallopeptidase [candidate division KSB1 bacterium]|nr:M23 family metallopeptidase [candidate division KSB1 bacterium]